MRIRRLVVLVVVLLSTSIIGQEEPLPAVVAKALPPLPSVALPIEPVIESAPPTLADAARANDYPTFATLYSERNDAAYAPLYELWTYSVTDPIGAFFGAEMYEKYARLYPGFAAFIEDHKIVDDRGDAYYPTSETRAFLLARAMEGVVADTTPVTPRPQPQPQPERVTQRAAATADPPAARVPAPPPVVEPAPAVEAALAEIAPPIVVTPQPEVAPAPAPAPAPIATSVAAPAAEPAPAPAASPRKALASRGLLLVIIGLIGIGLLALILRTPAGVEELPREP